MNTTFWYRYRDGRNYKTQTDIVFAGVCTFADIKGYLDDGVWFIPSQVGLEDIQHILFAYDGPGEDDHVWHEVAEDWFFPTDAEPTAPITAADFVAAMRQAHTDGWNSTAAMQRIGLAHTGVWE